MPVEPGRRDRATDAAEALRNRLERDLAVQGEEANSRTGDAGSSAPNEDSSEDGHSDRPTDPAGPASA